MQLMTKPKKQTEAPKPKFPSRDGYKGTYLPKALYDELEAFAEMEDRSTAFMVKEAVKRLLVDLRVKHGGESQ